MRLRGTQQKRDLADYEFIDLATYNAERGRGIKHTKQWRERMAAEQARFDQTALWRKEHTGR